MRKLFAIILFLLALLIAGPCWGANQYIKDGASGTYATTGCDTWENARACDDLPASLVRGTTYYIADGTYGRHTFQDACIGECDETDRITIKKSTIADHGTETGYAEADHNGQAVFTPADVTPTTSTKATFQINRSYYTIDGAVDGQGTVGSYGFRINLHPSYASEEGAWAGYVWSTFYGIMVGGAADTITNINIWRVATPGYGQSACVGYLSPCRSNGITFYFNPSKGGAFSTVDIGYCYSSGHKENYYIAGGSDLNLHHSYAHENTNSGEMGPYNNAHGQNINLDTVNRVYIYNNVVTDSSDFIIALHETFLGKIQNCKIYNNIFHGMASWATILSGGVSAMSGDYPIVNMQFYHNTFIDFPSLGKGAFFVAQSTSPETDKSYAYNNLFYNCTGAQVDNSQASSTNKGIIENDNNAYMASTGYSASAGNEIDAEAPSTIFTNYTGNVFSINAASQAAIDHIIDQGATSLFTTDFAGNTRPVGSGFDIGAYEAGGSADTTPPTVTSATINTDGDELTIAFPEIVNMNTSTGFTLNMSGGAAGLGYVSGSGTNSWLYNITGRNIDTAETGTLDYVTVANGIEDASGNDLASTGESDIAVTNNSTYTPSASTYTVTPSCLSGGCSISPTTPQVVVTGGTTQFTCTALNNFACVAWTGTCGGTGTTTFTTSAITGNCTVIQPCQKRTADAEIGSGPALKVGTGSSIVIY